MKKIIALLLAFMMIATTLTACGGKNASTDTTAETTEKIEENAFEVPPYDGGFELGNYEKDRYYNRYLGLGIKISKRWDVQSFEELMASNGGYADALSASKEEYEKMIREGNAAAFNDFSATEESSHAGRGTVIQVCALKTFISEEDTAKLKNDKKAFESFIKNEVLASMESGFEESGIYIKSPGEFIEMDINGKTATVIRYEDAVTVYDKPYFMDCIVKLVDDHVAIVMIASTVSELTVEGILDCIYILD